MDEESIQQPNVENRRFYDLSLQAIVSVTYTDE
jgi:hypothetical protein